MRSTTSSPGSDNAAPPTSTTSSHSVSKHHHHVHEDGWHLRLHPDRTITLHHPNGTLTHDGSTIDVAPTGTADVDLITLAHTRLEQLITERDTAAA